MKSSRIVTSLAVVTLALVATWVPTAAAAPAVATQTHAPSKPAAKPAAKPAGTDLLAGTKCQIFPTNNVWHSAINKLPVAKQNAAWLKSMNASTKKLHPDFGPNDDDPKNPYGIAITVVPAKTARVAVSFDYSDESDRIKYPLNSKTKIEGGPSADGDRHAIMVTADTCELFETYDTWRTRTGWTAGSGAHWSLKSNVLRPATWTSADAAGLPILPGLLRWSEVKAGSVNHAIRFTTSKTAGAFVWPARHQAGTGSIGQYPPMGARFRLKANFAITKYSKNTQTILKAMKTYGLILADNGSSWFFQGDADRGWPVAVIDELKKIPASAFEAVDASKLMVSKNSGQAKK